ncbi:hypothetical protein OEZ80_25875, partial [Leclercia adecarboxylata]|uniref:DUF7448 domain-containing protein n=1 Tax=Leclercia adecarboxylata TaxID=83655 RepID=UPI00234DDC4A
PIVALEIVDGHKLVIKTGPYGGNWLVIRDDGQSCCESRYMSTDDDLSSFVGATFLGCEIEDGPHEADDPDHETQFLIVSTSLGKFTVVNHNEHNGYYGGFSIRFEEM